MSDLISDYQALKARSIHRNGELQSTRRKLDQSKAASRKQTKDLDYLKEQYAIHTEASEVLKNIIEKKSTLHLQRVQDLLTIALRTVFPNRKYAIEIEIDDKRGANSATFFLLEDKDGEIIKSLLDGGAGGSVMTIVGFVMQVFYIRYFKLAPIIFIDEAFSDLYETHIPTLVEFMKELSKLKGFIFVMITHDHRVIPYADKTYRIESGRAREITKAAP